MLASCQLHRDIKLGVALFEENDLKLIKLAQSVKVALESFVSLAPTEGKGAHVKTHPVQPPTSNTAKMRP